VRRGGDCVAPELRAVEEEVDSAFRHNALIALPFATAAWSFLAFCEDRVMLPLARAMREGEETDTFADFNSADEMINHAKWPLRWLKQSCPAGGKVPRRFDDSHYEWAANFSELSSNYLWFESAFTYASLGRITLRLDGTDIVPCGTLRDDTRYEAYDRIRDVSDLITDAEASIPGDTSSPDVAVRVTDQWFDYKMSPRIVERTIARTSRFVRKRFLLPAEWSLTEYTVGDYLKVLEVLWAISMIHLNARLRAMTQGCRGLGYARALVVMRDDELIQRVVRYSGVAGPAVRTILADLTFGARGIRAPDPAIQPILRFTAEEVGWSPSIVANSALERNMIVLMNRIPEARSAYSRINQEKEGLLRESITSGLSPLRWRCWNGDVIGWPERLDIDLALISDDSRECLLLELKNFIAPAEPREIEERSEEIARGVQQIRLRRELASVYPEPLRKAMHIDGAYSITWAVVSANSIGGAWVQDESIPVVRASHLVEQALALKDMTALARWLSSRDYLPREGIDYRSADIDITVGRWTLKWFGMEKLA
jgi:hypothetical protein